MSKNSIPIFLPEQTPGGVMYVCNPESITQPSEWTDDLKLAQWHGETVAGQRTGLTNVLLCYAALRSGGKLQPHGTKQDGFAYKNTNESGIALDVRFKYRQNDTALLSYVAANSPRSVISRLSYPVPLNSSAGGSYAVAQEYSRSPVKVALPESPLDTCFRHAVEIILAGVRQDLQKDYPDFQEPVPYRTMCARLSMGLDINTGREL